GLESDSDLLARAVSAKPGGAPQLPRSRNNALAVHARCTRRDRDFSGRLFARQLLFDPPRRRRGTVGSVRRLQEQRRALPNVPKLLPDSQATLPSGVGKERSLFSA